MIYQLPEPFQVDTPLGHGYAIMLEAGSHDYWWTVALDSGALVTFTQDRIRVSNSYSHRRGISDEQMRGIIDGKKGGLHAVVSQVIREPA